MALHFDDLIFYYEQCDPEEQLAPHDKRNVDIDARGIQGEKPRGVNWSDRMLGQIKLSTKRPLCILFSGLPGSGKSTELKRLVEKLQQPSSKGPFVPVMINAEEVIDLSNPIDIPDILASIVYAAERKVLEIEGADPRKALSDGYLRRFWEFLNRTEFELKTAGVSLKGENLGLPIDAELSVEMKNRPSLRERIRSIISEKLTTFLKEIHNELEGLNLRIKKRGYQSLVIIFDSLEKLRGMNANYSEVIDSAERLFGNEAPHMQLPVHVIYTVPPVLLSRTSIKDINFMPMIKLYNQGDTTPFPPGLDTVRELIRRRIPDAVLAELLGRIIQQSGGYPRELIRLLQAVLRVNPDSLPISEDEFERIFQEVSDDFSRFIPTTSFPWLARVFVSGLLEIEDEEQRRLIDKMLSSNGILRYLNTKEWFDLHPAVRNLPGVKAAIVELNKARQAATAAATPS
jgi:hypothetical protein